MLCVNIAENLVSSEAIVSTATAGSAFVASAVTAAYDSTAAAGKLECV